MKDFFKLGDLGALTPVISDQDFFLVTEILVMNFWENLQRKILKRGRGGQRPFTLFLEIHQFCQRQAPLMYTGLMLRVNSGRTGQTESEF